MIAFYDTLDHSHLKGIFLSQTDLSSCRSPALGNTLELEES